MSDVHHAAVLQWLATAGLGDVTLSCQESPLDGTIVLDRCLKDVPLAWLVELAEHSTLHIAVDHCEHAAETRHRFHNLASITERILLDGDATQGAQVRYSAPPPRGAGVVPLGGSMDGPRGTHAERLAVALAALRPRERTPTV